MEGGKPISSTHPELMTRFVKESSLTTKSEWLPDVDFMDVNCRNETIHGTGGESLLLQMPLAPAYGLTVHKTQALSIKHVVDGCTEGMFATGHLYVLISRVTDPRNLHLIGLPPKDMLEDVEKAWRAAGLDVDKCWESALSVTSEWIHTRGPQHISERIVQKRIEERRIPLKHRSLAETLNPMPRASKVIHELLDWIDECDMASQRNEARPPFREEIFDEDRWWLSDLQRREVPEKPTLEVYEDGPESEKEQTDEEVDSDPMSGSEQDLGEIPEGLLQQRQRLDRAVKVCFRTTRKRKIAESQAKSSRND